MTTTTPTGAAKLKTSAMIASFADPGQKTTPAPFGHALVKAAQDDDRIVGLSADLAKYTDMHIFAQAFPERFFQIGMAEQLLLGAAAGMAEAGLIPFASTYSVFATRRAYDFLCLDVAEPGLNVNVVGGLPGLTTGYGPSHQATEDIAIFRGIPGLTIVDPCDSIDIEQAVPQLAALPAPPTSGCSAARSPPCSTSTTTPSSSARPRCCDAGRDVVFVSSGLMTMRALQAAERLAEHHVDVAVVHSPTIKPFDAATVLAEIDTDRLAVTLREPHRDRRTLRDRRRRVVTGRTRTPDRARSPCPTSSSTPAPCPTLHDRYGLATDRIVANASCSWSRPDPAALERRCAAVHVVNKQLSTAPRRNRRPPMTDHTAARRSPV